MKNSHFNSIWQEGTVRKNLLLTVELEIWMEKAVEVSNSITSRDKLLILLLKHFFLCFHSGFNALSVSPSDPLANGFPNYCRQHSCLFPLSASESTLLFVIIRSFHLPLTLFASAEAFMSLTILSVPF